MLNVIGFRLQVLKRPEYFGKFGKIHKVVINNSTSYAGSQVKITVFTVSITFLHHNLKWSDVRKELPVFLGCLKACLNDSS